MDARLDVRVGGRLEAAAPTHSVPAKDRLALCVLFVLAIAIHGWLFARTTVNARDGLSFTRVALQIEMPGRMAGPGQNAPSMADVLRNAQQPPGYPLAMLAVSKVVRAVNPITAEPGNHADAQLGERMLVSGQLANCLASILLVVPMFLLGRLIGGRFVGLIGVAFFQVLPVAAQVTSDTLSEGCYLLGLSTALWLGCRGLRRTGIGNFLAAGGIAGLTYLVRPEGMLVVLAIGIMVVWQGIRKMWPWNLTLGCLAALGVGVSFTALPYMLIIGGFTNKSSGVEVIKRFLGNPAMKMKWEQGGGQAKVNPILFAEFDKLGEVTATGRVIFAMGAVVREMLKSAHYAPVLLAAFGIFALRRRFRFDPAIALLGFFLFLNLSLLFAFAAKIGYVSERHTVPVAMVLCPLAAAGIVPFIVFVSRYSIAPISSLMNPRRDRWLVALAIMISAIPLAIRPLHESRIGFRHAGNFLAEVFQDGDIIVDPFSWAEFYAGPAVTRLIPETDTGKVLYTVLDGPNDKSPHVRLPKMDLARNIAKSGKPVYHWPDDQPIENAKVIVYKTVR